MLSCLFPPLPAQPQFYPQVRIKTAGTANAGHKFPHRAYCSGRGRCPAPRSPGENLRVPETSRAPCVLRSPGPGKQQLGLLGLGVSSRGKQELVCGSVGASTSTGSRSICPWVVLGVGNWRTVCFFRHSYCSCVHVSSEGFLYVLCLCSCLGGME